MQKDPQLMADAVQLCEEGVAPSVIEEKLAAAGADADTIREVTRKLDCFKKRERGKILVLVGVVLLGLGFIMTVMLFHQNNLIDMVMYGFTTIGVLVLFAGLYLIFG